eukprot:222366_1
MRFMTRPHTTHDDQSMHVISSPPPDPPSADFVEDHSHLHLNTHLHRSTDAQGSINLNNTTSHDLTNGQECTDDILGQYNTNYLSGHGSANAGVLEGQGALSRHNWDVQHDADGHELDDTLSHANDVTLLGECTTNNANVSNTFLARRNMDPSHAHTTNAYGIIGMDISTKITKGTNY